VYQIAICSSFNTISNNTIRDSGLAGVAIPSATAVSNTITTNTFSGNTELGIELEGLGQEPNDVPMNLDADTGANDLQNHPILYSAITNGVDDVLVAYSLSSEAGTTYRIEFFASESSDTTGSGAIYLGSAVETSSAFGLISESASLNSAVPAGYLITATATKFAGGTVLTSTSEFSSSIVATSGGNTAPTITTISNLTVDENLNVVDTLAVNDPDPDTHIWTISGGADATMFSITADTGVLSLNSPRDKEAADDRIYVVEVQVSDGSATNQKSFNISIDDVDEFNVTIPTDQNLNADEVSESAAIGDTVGVTALAVDADATDNVTYSLINDTSGLFSIDAAGVVRVSAALDAETAGSHSFTIQALSSDTSVETMDVVITVLDEDEFPLSAITDVNTAIDQIDENTVGMSSVGVTAQATDVDVGDIVTYSLTDDAGGRFSIDNISGVVSQIAALDAEVSTSHSITVQANSTKSGTQTADFIITVQDLDESPIGAVTDLNPSNNVVLESATIGMAVGITALAIDPDVSDDVTYQLSNDAGGRFEIDPSTGVITVASALNAETGLNHSITVQATSTRSGTTSTDFIISVGDVDEFDVVTPFDTNSGSNEVLETATMGTTVGITALAMDGDISDSVSYSLISNAGGLFTINSSSGVVTVANALDAETSTSHNITVRATSDDSSIAENTFSITVLDVDEFPISSITDIDLLSNAVDENAAIGSSGGVTAFTTDLDLGDDVSYSLTNDAGGLFAINPTTGSVTVAGALDAETATEHTITVMASSTRSGTTSNDFLISVNDIDEFNVIMPVDTDVTNDEVLENATIGTSVGIIAQSSDADVTDNVTYFLSNDAGGLFAINAISGVVTVAGALDAETALSHNITIRAISDDSSTIENTFSIAIRDVDEFSVSPLTDTDVSSNQVLENTVGNANVGVTAFATDGDVSDDVTYSLTNDANGRFSIDNNSGVISQTGALDAEAGSSYLVTVQALSISSGSRTADFIINVLDTDEFSVTAPIDSDTSSNEIIESAAIGALVGIRANAVDVDISDDVTYSLTNDAGGRFTINATSGVVSVAAALDAENASSHNITIRATSDDFSFDDSNFIIAVLDADESALSAVSDSDLTVNAVDENVTVGTLVGITAQASDSDLTDDVTYSLTDDAGGLFAIHATTGVVTVAGVLDTESAAQHTIRVQASSTRSGVTEANFIIDVKNIDEFNVTTPVDSDIANNSILENALIGTSVGITAQASDGDQTDDVTYSLINDADGRFAIGATTGVVTVVGSLNAETTGNHNITIRASSDDGSFEDSIFSINVIDSDEFPLSAVSDSNVLANQIDENSVAGSLVGITAVATDLDATDDVTYSLTNDAAGLFAINATTGVITVEGILDAETAHEHTITVLAISTRSGTSSANFLISVNDLDEFNVSKPVDTDTSANEVLETAATGTLTGITADATDADISDTISYSLTDNANGRFEINSSTGIVTVAGALDAEAANSHNITIRATSDDTSFDETTVVINVVDIDESSLSPVTDGNLSANTVDENSVNGTLVGVTAVASDPDLSDEISYSLTNDAGGLFAIDSNTGVVTVAGILDAETNESHTITVQATSSRSGSTRSDFLITINHVNEFDVTTSVDSNTAANEIFENAEVGTPVGITAVATDADGNDSVGYSLSNSSNGLFTIDASTGIVSVATAGALDVDIQSQHTITITALSSDGSSSDTSFDIAIHNRAPVIPENQSLSLPENMAGSLLIGTINAVNTTSPGTVQDWQIHSGNESGLFEINPDSGNLYLANGQSLDFESSNQYTLSLSVSDGVNRSDEVSVQVLVTDQNDFPIATSDNLTTNEDSALSIAISTLINNDIDADGDNLTIISVGSATNGTVQETATGVIVYTPNPEFSGTDRFEYTASDGQGGSSTSHVFIDVNDVNDQPEIIVASTVTVDENLTIIDANIQASDRDGDQLRFSLSGDDASHFTINEMNGEIHFINAPDFEKPNDSDGDNQYSMQVNVNDPDGLADTQTLLVNVANANDRPTVSADEISIGEYNSGSMGSIKVTDQDLGDTHNFEIVDSNTLDAILIEDNGDIVQIDALPPGIYYLDVMVRDQAGGEVLIRVDVQVVGEPSVDLGAANPLNVLNFTSISLPTFGENQTSVKPDNNGASVSGANINPSVVSTSLINTVYSAGNGLATEIGSEEAVGKDARQHVAQDVRKILNEAFAEANMVAGEYYVAQNPPGNDSSAVSGDLSNQGKQLILDVLLSESNAVDSKIKALADSFGSQFGDIDLSPQLLNALQSLKNNAETNYDEASHKKELVVTSVTVISGTLTVGIITWLLNSGSLLATAVTTSPLWRSIDPIPVLANRTDRNRSTDQ